jgi:hypothetical protein
MRRGFRVNKYFWLIFAACVAIYVFGMVVSHFNPPTFSSDEWTAVPLESIQTLELVPLRYRNYSLDETLSDSITINEAPTIKQLVSELDGRFTYLDFGKVRMSGRKQFNIRILSTQGTFWFRVRIAEDKSGHLLAQYSEIRPNTIHKFGDEQRFYGHLEASRELAQRIDEIIVKHDIKWMQVSNECF